MYDILSKYSAQQSISHTISSKEMTQALNTFFIQSAFLVS
jgi:hypothetical protein